MLRGDHEENVCGARCAAPQLSTRESATAEQKRDNAFVQISDFPRAQKLAEGFASVDTRARSRGPALPVRSALYPE